MTLTLALNSLGNRKGSVFLTLLAMTVSVFVLLGVEHIRSQAKASFASTISGVDLIVGARTSNINLLLYSVFRIGAPTNNIGWESYEALASNNKVAWTIPISLGDSHEGYRVMGTSKAYFEHFQYGNKQPLDFADGQAFEALYDVVLGAEVAKTLNYQLGDKIILAHGIGATSFSLHEESPFEVVGILAPTGTPVDQALHVSLEGIEAIHSGTHGEAAESIDLTPESITAIFIGLESKLATFTVQRSINNYSREPLVAVLPGVALSELWQIMNVLENTLRLISSLVMLSALLGLAAMLLASLRERATEIQLLRTIGASPRYLFLLIQVEALLISISAIACGALLLQLTIQLLQATIASHYGVQVSSLGLSSHNLMFFIMIILATIFVASLPSAKAYQQASRV